MSNKGKNKKIGHTLLTEVTIKDLKGREIETAPLKPEIEVRAKVSTHFINSYFTTEDTLKGYQGQLTFDFKTKQDIAKTKENLAVIVSKGFKGINLSYQENRVIKGLFSLLQRQDASEDRPFIVLDNISQLYDEVLEKKVTKKLKDGYEFKDFSGAEVKRVNEALDNLSKAQQQIIIKGHDGIDKKTKKPLYFFYMKEASLLGVEYLKRKIPEGEAGGITEGELKETGQIKISILSIFLRDYHKYYKMLPKDISKEVRQACPEVKRISKPIVNFIDFLHRQDKRGLINGNELRRNRLTLIKELKLEEQRQKRGKQYIKDILFKCYDIAKRTGYLEDYKIDQEGKFELVDVFYLNIFKFDHLKPKRVKEAPKEGLEYAQKP